MTKALAIGALVTIGGAICVLSGLSFYHTWSQQLGVVPECQDRSGVHREAVPQELAGYYKCVDDRARVFLEHDFAETKDLAKAFLTLLTAILVASITFSEKIVDLSNSKWSSRAIMIGSWILVLFAIATSGAGLALMANAAGYAVYFPHADYRVLEADAVKLFIVAGLSFGGGLVLLLVAGIVSLVDRRARPNTVVASGR